MFEALHVYKTYEQAGKALHVLKGVSLKIAQGDFLAIVGPSGAGKSTLLHILGGLDRPTDGQVFFEEAEVYKMNDQKRSAFRNEKIGFVFQFYHLLPEFDALENVILPALVKSDMANKQEIEHKGLRILDRIGLKGRVHHKPNQLSGGEQQRVAIARALMNDPKVIFCDEPTGNLDSETGHGIIKLLMELNQERKQTIVLVTHDKYIAELSRRVIQMKDGQILN